MITAKQLMQIKVLFAGERQRHVRNLGDVRSEWPPSRFPVSSSIPEILENDRALYVQVKGTGPYLVIHKETEAIYVGTSGKFMIDWQKNESMWKGVANWLSSHTKLDVRTCTHEELLGLYFDDIPGYIAAKLIGEA